MFKNLSIKIKLIASFAIIALFVLILAGYSVFGVSKSSKGFTSYREMAKSTVLSSGVQSNMLMVRMNVKDYLVSNNKKDIDEFNIYYKKTKKYIQEALEKINKSPRAAYVKEMNKEFNVYKNDFFKVVDFMKQRDDIVFNNLNINGQEIEKLLTSVMVTADADENLQASIEAGYGVRILLLTRLYTVKFLDSNSNSDANRIHKEFDDLEEQLEEIKDLIQNPSRMEKLNKAVDLIKTYKDGVNKIVTIINQRNSVIDNLNTIGPKIAKLAEEVKLSIKKDQDTIGPEVAKLNDNIFKMSIIIGIIVIVLVLLSAVFISREISFQLERFQRGLLGFFKYLNRESKNVEMLDDSSSNEIGTMSKVVNENIEKTKKGIEEDRKFIDDAVTILSEFEQGDLTQRITTKVNNPALMDLRKVLNSMGEHLEENINEILDVLEKFTNYNYLNQVQTSNVKHHLLNLSNGVNNLGSSIVTMLRDEKRVGLTLNSSSDTLLKNVKILNDVSNEAAASLEETAAALEEMTGTIISNTQNVVDMADFAHKVTKSVDEGNELANQTTASMDEINEKVTAINESITVIDQIAFQTNILSLNAAVEAATAGEAGKGFAVVAQEVRNLAARSAEAAKEIKELVEDANEKTNSGKTITDKMIHGYTNLNVNIKKTIELINNVEAASKEQKSGIEQINNAVTVQDQQTQQIANAANETQEIAMNTSQISKSIVKKVDEKEFLGKKEIEGTQTKELHLENKNKVNKSSKKTQKIQEEVLITDKDSKDEEWESF